VHLPLAQWGATRFVSASPIAEFALTRGHWRQLVRIGRFAVWEDPDPQPLAPAGTRDGAQLALELDGDTVVARAYHAFWDVESPDGAQLTMGPQGRMAIINLPPGRQRVVLAYDPPRVWPVSVAGWLGIAGLAALGARRRRATT
jgi:MYXO-CTERM domain-containing protein